MQTKLTLRMETQLISSAKRVAQKRGKALSQLVADYFRLLEQESEGKRSMPEVQSTPWTQSLIGIAKPEHDYHSDTEHLRLDYLSEKYQLALESPDENSVR